MSKLWDIASGNDATSSETETPPLGQTTVDDFLIATSKEAWELSGNTGDALFAKIHQLQDFTQPQEASDWAVFVSKEGDRYYVISYEDALLFSLERTQDFNELRTNPETQGEGMRIAMMQQMASLMLLNQGDTPPKKIKTEVKDLLLKVFRQTLEISTAELKETQPSIPPEHRQGFEQQVQSGVQQLQMESEYHAEALAGYWSGEMMSADQLNAITNFMIRTRGEPTPERLLWLMETWMKTPELPNPLIPLIRAWQQEQTAKHITAEYDANRPVTVLRSGSLGSIRDVVLDMEGAGQSPVIIPNSEQIQADQLTLWQDENDSILPDYVPYHRLWDGRSTKTTKSGAVSHGVRIADEAFFPFKKGETKVELKFDLGMLLKASHPDLTETQITKNRGTYLKYIINGLHEVQYLGWEYVEDGTPGLWVPVKMPDNFMPSIQSPDDFAIRMTVTLPASPTYNGMMAGKFPLRLTGKRSLLQRNALRTSYWIFDRFGTVGKTLIDPTRPKEVWDDEGNLIDQTGKNMFERGKPIKNPYHHLAVKELGREDNEKAIERYPRLKFDDLLKACFPLGYPQGEKAKYLKRALKAWEALEKEGFIRIDKSPDGWRIMPSDSHMRAYRGLKEAIKKSKKK